ncbi:MAG: histidine triad nucleotide-binding protein [bacterium]
MDCLFCKIVEKKIKSDILYEDKECIAFSDINPQAPVHFLVIPKKHIPTTLAVREEDKNLVGHMVMVAAKIAGDKKIDISGFRLVLNCNPDSGQVIYHIHMHVLGGRKMGWPPG